MEPDRAEVFKYVKEQWTKLKGALAASSPQHGYKLCRKEEEQAVNFVELVGSGPVVGVQPERFRRFCIVPRYDAARFRQELETVGTEEGYSDVGDKLKIHVDAHADLKVDIIDWTDWKTTVRLILKWSWARTDR